MMTKKHFIKIAEVLGNQTKVDIQLVNELMDLFETFNSNFNRNIFLKKVVDCKKIYISDEDSYKILSHLRPPQVETKLTLRKF